MIIIVVSAIVLVYILWLFYVQVIDKSYQVKSENNTMRNITLFPPRGLIYDRDGLLLVSNEVAYDLMVVPRLVKPMDTLAFCNILNIDIQYFREQLHAARNYSRYKASIMASQLSKEMAGYFQEKLYEFPGFYLQSRTIRLYDEKIAAHAIGYIGEVDRTDIAKDDYYRAGDYIGRSGIEAFYERELRGKKGKSVRLVDVHNRLKGSYQNGTFDEDPVPGQSIYMTLDAELQKFAEMLMQGKKGSITAIEPATGEVLVMVSNPDYNPNLLVGYDRSKNYKMLAADSLRPLFNRAVSAKYPPGSTFKMATGLAALQENIIKPSTCFMCNGQSTKPIRCTHNHKSPLNLYEAIEESCNPYFWSVYKAFLENAEGANTTERFLKWRDYMLAMGFGERFDNDILYQSKGNIPTNSYFDRYYGKGKWNALTIRSLSIGQGEVELTPLQMANYVATIANRGYYVVPHLAREIAIDSIYVEKLKFETINTGINPEYYESVIEGMWRVYNGARGTMRYYSDKELNMCGKTGTAQNPHGKDHSLFVAFAPKDNPKIVVSVIVENAGFGATWAGPIGTLIMEQYLKGNTRNTWWKEKVLTQQP
ncbi:MAG: penicillin-binding protein 2 [Bacteroidales bacterium]|nr:penicillin-binding protein 2 [Bacteroidales bacterium]